VTFERPEAWWLLALALPVVALHLHLTRRRVVPVSSLLLWRGLLPDRSRRGGLRFVRDGLALAFLLAALAAFTAAAAGPVAGAPADAPRRLAIVLDASASMLAKTRTGTRFDEALDAARAAIGRLAPQDEVCVWLATPSPRVIVEPTTDRAAALAALADRAAATLERRNLTVATRLAVRAAPGVAGRAATVLVLTDAPGAEALRTPDAPSVDLRVGVVDGEGTPRNAGIVAFDVDRADARRFAVRVATTDGDPAPRTLVLRRGDAEVARAEVGFGADGEASATLPAEAFAAGGLAVAALEPGDDFAEDDAARIVLPAARPLAVAVLADTPSPFLVEALRAMPDVADPARTTLVKPGAPWSAFSSADVVVADGAAAPEGRPSLSFGAGGRVVDRPLLWSVGTHAVTEGVDLSPLRIESASLVEPAHGETTIVGSASGAVGVAGEDRGVRRVRLGFRPEATTLPLEAAFPLLVRNALRWLASPAGAPRYVVAGEPVPGGGGALVPYPPPGGPYDAALPGGASSVVRWTAPPGFRLGGPTGDATSAAAAARALPDRSGVADTRRRFAPMLAGAGCAALFAGALLLSRGRPRVSAPPPSTDTASATASREAAHSTPA
jgi:VWA domain-containing protein